MTNEIVTPEIVNNTPVMSDSDMEMALQFAERNEKMCRKIKLLSIKQTNRNDWEDMEGKPYLKSSGAEKIARLFGIAWGICEGYPLKEMTNDDKGAFYIYKCQLKVTMGGKSIEVMGTCSQKDKFFGQKHGQPRPLSEIDETNIIRKAYTNAEVNGVTRMLGLRNLTWEELAEAGVERGNTHSVNFKNSSKEALSVVGKIVAGNVKSGAKNGKPWKLYEFTVGDVRMSTFDTTLGELAQNAQAQNQTVSVTYRNDGKGNKIEAVEVIQQEEMQGEAEDCD